MENVTEVYLDQIIKEKIWYWKVHGEDIFFDWYFMNQMRDKKISEKFFKIKELEDFSSFLNKYFPILKNIDKIMVSEYKENIKEWENKSSIRKQEFDKIQNLLRSENINANDEVKKMLQEFKYEDILDETVKEEELKYRIFNYVKLRKLAEYK